MQARWTALVLVVVLWLLSVGAASAQIFGPIAMVGFPHNDGSYDYFMRHNVLYTSEEFEFYYLCYIPDVPDLTWGCVITLNELPAGSQMFSNFWKDPATQFWCFLCYGTVRNQPPGSYKRLAFCFIDSGADRHTAYDAGEGRRAMAPAPNQTSVTWAVWFCKGM